MPKMVVLNWYGKNSKWVRGLKKLLRKAKSEGGCTSFVTLRLGPKWANKLNPGQKVVISISDDPAKPEVIGTAEVGTVRKDFLGGVSKKEWEQNIGANNRWDAQRDMEKVYGVKINPMHDFVSVIELFASTD